VLRQVKTNAAIKQTYFMHRNRNRNRNRNRQTRKEKLLKNVAHVQPIVSWAKKKSSPKTITHKHTLIHSHTHPHTHDIHEMYKNVMAFKWPLASYIFFSFYLNFYLLLRIARRN